MSYQSLERAIRHEAQTVLKNPRLRNKDILAWNSGPLLDPAQEGEIVVWLTGMGVNILVSAEMDKRQ